MIKYHNVLGPYYLREDKSEKYVAMKNEWEIKTIINNHQNNRDHKGTNGIYEMQMLTKIILTQTAGSTS